MFGITVNFCVFVYASLMAIECILGQQQHHQQHHFKPWPTYSLQNMPQTRFTCHDKILGGYYADPETQCQMFHVCVKVSGGVQDFRFLCPNSTAFDQEAQICADWGDVDCEQSVLYYGSDNFDLYRIGSGFESKRAPLAEEEEATFHLQRAESADIRRWKETRVDQKLRPDQTSQLSYTKQQFAPTTTRNPHVYANLAAQRNPQRSNYNNYNNNNNDNDDVNRLPHEAITKQPIANFYAPTTTTTTTTTRKPKPSTSASTLTTTTTTERYTDESRQDFEEIFKGSHSSHYFANRNGGREDESQDAPSKTKQNDFNDYSRKQVEASPSGKTRVQPTRTSGQRGRQQFKTSNVPTPSTTQRSTATTKFNKNAHVFYQTDINAFVHKPATPPAAPSPAPTPASSTTTTILGGSAVNRFSFNSHDFRVRDKILPTTYNPLSSVYRVKATTPKYQPPNHFHGVQLDSGDGVSAKAASTAAPTRRKPQKAPLDSAQNSSFVNHAEFAEFSRIKTQEPQPFKPAQLFRPPPLDSGRSGATRTPVNQTEPRPRARGQTTKAPAPNYHEPKPFSTPQRQRSQPKQQQQNAQPRGFSNRGSISYKATTQRSREYTNFNNNNNEYSSSSQVPKKFSTLVPKDGQQQLQPTTFKPTTYKKAYDAHFYQSQQPPRPLAAQPAASSSTSSAPQQTPNEDDGQYHPELYEVDFPKNRVKVQRSTTTPKTPTAAKPKSNKQFTQTHLKTQQQSFLPKQEQQPKTSDSGDLSDEEEFFKTAHSLNFGAASINKLRADIFKAEKTSQQYNAQYAANQPSLVPAKTAAPSYLPTASSAALSQPTNTPSTTLFANIAAPTTTLTPVTPRTASPTTAQTTIATRATTTRYASSPSASPPPSQSDSRVALGAAAKIHKDGHKKSSSKAKKTPKSASKRPPHADEDTSYDYAYYDSDSLSESPQAYPDYEIAEFAKTRKN